MKEVKTPKKPLAYYYGIVLIVLIVFNLVVTPILMEHQVKETDYGTFMSMIEKKNIGEVEVKDNQIIFTDKDQKNIYKTGLMNDPNLTDRLYECGAVFAKDIDKQMSPIISFLLTGVLPLILFIALGNYMAKKLMEHAGGKNSMAFGMGKSNAKIYVQSSEGIRFSDVAGEDEAKENLSEMVDRYLEKGTMYVLEDNDVKAECVVTDEGNGILEIKNIAVDPENQGKGYGKALIDFLASKYADEYSVLQVGTGDSPLTIPFYEKCGFVRSHKIPNFFTDNYDHPIYEGGVQLIDMVYLQRHI